MIDLTNIQPYLHVAVAAFLPLLVALIAGAIRQDGLPNTANEIISYAVVIVVALVQAFTDGKLGGSPIADFMIVAGYSQAALHSALLQKLQQYLQVNVFTFVKAPVVTPPAVFNSTPPASVDYNTVAQMVFDLLNKNAGGLAALMAVELAKQLKATSGASQPAPPAQYAQPAPPTSGGGYPGYNGSTLGVATHVDQLPTDFSIPAIRLNVPNRAG